MADEREPPLGEDGALAVLAAGAPQLTWRSARYIDEGWDHEVLLLDDDLVVRFPNAAYYRDMLDTEAAVLTRLDGRVRAALPRPILVAPDRRFAVHRIVRGEQVRPEVLAALAPADRAEVASQLAELLTAIHSLDPADLPRDAPSWDVAEENEEMVRLARERLPALLDTEELARVHAVLDDVPALLAAAPRQVLVHGDVYEDHLLWDAGARRLGLIDFSDLAIGDPALDFAELSDYGRAFVEEVAGRYGGPVDDGLVDRAERYGRWLAVYLLTDHLVTAKTSFAVARIPFDRRTLPTS